ncbi:glycosyltransferase family 4 protein [Thalassotalea agariperforans]
MTIKRITVGLTEAHGMALEQAQYPNDEIEYKFLNVARKGSPIFHSPIIGYMSKFNENECDIVEAILSPTHTKKPWLYSLAVFQEALAFNIKGIPIPKYLRCKYAEYLFSQDNFKKFLFWSEAGKSTLKTYGNITNQTLWDKSEVVYPAINAPDEALVQYKKSDFCLLFSGDFFRKGGVNVIDVFERIQKIYPSIRLILACDENIDFKTDDLALRNKYLEKISKSPKISMGRIPRKRMLKEILPQTDVYLLPTYNEAFGFAVLEAMAFGIPVIATNCMAMPEMITQNETGLMIDTSKYDCEQLFKGYYVKSIPQNFCEDVTHQLSEYLTQILASEDLRRHLGTKAREVAKNKFSFAQRHKTMKKIYRDAIT